MKKEYTIAGITGIIALLLIVGYDTFYNRDYLDILKDNLDQDVFIMDFNSKERVEVLTRTTNCPYGLLRIDPTEIKLKCGWRVAGVFSSWTEYWRTYGKNPNTGEEAWWVRNNRKVTQITLDYKTDSHGNVIVIRTTPFYKGRYGSDGILTEEFLIYGDGLKITAKYFTYNENVIHRIIYRADKETDYIDFDSYDPDGNFKYSWTTNNKKHYSYGEKKGNLNIDPSIVLVSPNDKGATTNITGDTLTFSYNCSRDGMIIENSSLFTIWNSTLGWNESAQNTTADNNFQYNSVDWVLPAFVDMWPYGWKVQCCTNETIRDFCVNSSVRLIAVNVRPSSSGFPTISDSTVRTDESFSCSFDASLITATSRLGRFSYTSDITNGIVNLTWRVVNNSVDGVNHTWIHNTPNLTINLDRDTRAFNLTAGASVNCSVLITDGVQNSSVWYTSTLLSATDGEVWDLDITSPDSDINILSGDEDSKIFTVNWSAPKNPDGDNLYYSGWLQTTPGFDSYHLFNYSVLNLTGNNLSSYDGVHNITFNSSDYATGNYYIKLTACEVNFSGHPGAKLCVSDTTTNTLDIYDYTVVFGPGGISTARFDMPVSGGTGTGFKPYGQTPSIGLFLATFTALGDLNFTINLNNTTHTCMDVLCAPYNKATIYDNATYSNEQGWNLTNYTMGPENSTIYKVTKLSNYIWCYLDVTSVCPINIAANFDWVFNVWPDSAAAY